MDLVTGSSMTDQEMFDSEFDRIYALEERLQYTAEFLEDQFNENGVVDFYKVAQALLKEIDKKRIKRIK